MLDLFVWVCYKYYVLGEIGKHQWQQSVLIFFNVNKLSCITVYKQFCNSKFINKYFQGKNIKPHIINVWIKRIIFVQSLLIWFELSIMQHIFYLPFLCSCVLRVVKHLFTNKNRFSLKKNTKLFLCFFFTLLIGVFMLETQSLIN